MRIKRDVKSCYGCRTCELACSFHHQGVFSPEISSIKVSRNNRNGRIKWTIDSTCDLCSGKTERLCVEFCPNKALSEEQQ